MDKFIGKWEVTRTENMGEMLKAFDMEESMRQMYENMRFIMEYHLDGDTWTYTVYMTDGKSKTFQYKLGSEFDSTTLDGRPIVSKIDSKDGKFVELHKDKADPTLDAHMVREIVGDELLVTATVKGVSSVTRHKKI